MILSEDDFKYLKENGGWLIWINGEQIPVGPGFDYETLQQVFDDLVEERGVEETAEILGYEDAKEMVIDMADILDNQYTIDDLVLDGTGGKAVDDIDYEAAAADHKADKLAGR